MAVAATTAAVRPAVRRLPGSDVGDPLVRIVEIGSHAREFAVAAGHQPVGEQAIGEFPLDVALHTDVLANITVAVVAE